MSEYTRCHSSEMLHGKYNKSVSEPKEKPQQYLLTMLRFGMVFVEAPQRATHSGLFGHQSTTS